MENFINIVFDQKQEVDDIVVSEVATSASNALLEEETGYELYDTNDGKTVLTVETHVQPVSYTHLTLPTTPYV